MPALTIPERELLTIYLHQPEKFDHRSSYDFYPMLSIGLPGATLRSGMLLEPDLSDAAPEEENFYRCLLRVLNPPISFGRNAHQHSRSRH